MSTNNPNNPFSREGAESLAHTIRQAQRAMEEHPLSGVHINQSSADAMADAYDAEYQASKATTTPSGADVLALTTESHRGEMAKTVDHVLTIPDTAAMLLPSLGVVPLQLFSYYIALQRGCDIDKPRNLAKSVTVE